ncbi:histidinol-phosphatase [Cerasicoccus arenae]|uniref:Histidinol-phosphatase n=1 Tax=Cerasicoccus arenae TaxID=424488 RepID=A0A8J3DIM8_9BACT|nr:histidinol-phosphatase [Cerasicoccus arenae]MBK1856644.1 histidinol-phosphatase [Cerasicoccus arenae]GHC12263.1 histidinol-phosphatase [Cerasicoccus arenae]
MDLAPFKSFAQQLADVSGERIRGIWETDDLGLEFKEDNTPVTRADREAEELMRAMIKKRFPDHGIIAEEFGNENEDAEFVWILDPIDGTKSFMSHVPLFGTLIGLLRNGEPILGLINQPILRQCLIGDNETTTLNGKIVKARPQLEIEKSILLTTDPNLIEMTDDIPGLKKLVQSVYLRRTWGDCYGYLLVATGRADIMIDPILAPWDLLPLVPVIRGAGAMITDWQGQAPNLHNVTSAVAAHPYLHQEVIHALRKS